MTVLARFSSVKLWRLSERTFLNLEKDLSTSTLTKGQNLKAATSEKKSEPDPSLEESSSACAAMDFFFGIESRDSETMHAAQAFDTILMQFFEMPE